MNKADFVRAYADIRGKTKEEAKEDIETILELIASELTKGRSIRFAGYFSMERILKKPRSYRDPLTKKLTVSAPKYDIRFKTGSHIETMLEKRLEDEGK